MLIIKLSELAKADINEIFEFGLERFGTAQAVKYQEGIYSRIRDIAERPLTYQAVDVYGKGFRRSVYISHVIYFEVQANTVLIQRVLGQQDIESSFSQ